MKILVLTNKLPYPPRDGGSIATLNMLTGLTDAGNQVTCMSLNTHKHNFPVKEIPKALSGRIRFLAIDCDSSIKPVRLLINLLFSIEPYIAVRFNKKDFRSQLELLLKQEAFDLVQLEGPYPGHYLDTIRAGCKAKVSLRAHNVEHIIWKRKAAHEKYRLKRWYLANMASRVERFEMKVVGHCDCLVTISPLDLAYFVGQGSTLPAITIPTGLSMEAYPLTSIPAETSLFFIGALDWLPNQEGLKWFLENVFSSLCEAIPGIRFHVAGRNAPKSVLHLLQDKNIIYHGEVEDAREFMKAYRVMIAPLLTGSGIRIKIIEAMALGRPVVTTPVGIEGIPAVSGREVLVSDNPEAFKDQVITLITDDNKARTLVEAGRTLIQEKFDTFGLSARLSRFFNEQV